MSCENACKILPAAKQWKWPAQTKFKKKKQNKIKLRQVEKSLRLEAHIKI